MTSWSWRAATSASRSVPVGWSSRVISTFAPKASQAVTDPFVVGGDDHLVDTLRPPRALPDVFDHGSTGDRRERLAREPGRAVASGKDGENRHGAILPESDPSEEGVFRSAASIGA